MATSSYKKHWEMQSLSQAPYAQLKKEEFWCKERKESIDTGCLLLAVSARDTEHEWPWILEEAS